MTNDDKRDAKHDDQQRQTSRAKLSRSRRWWLGTALLAGLPLTAGTAGAFVVATQPAAVKIAPPPSVLPGALTGPDIHAFDERQDFPLAAALFVDHQGPGAVDSPNDLKPGWIPAGTCVRSHYVHYDPANVVPNINGAVQFEGQILGVIVRPASLDASNGLGAAFTNYPPNAAAAACLNGAATCGLELSPVQDGFEIVGPDVVRMSFNAGNPGDRMRVITKSCGCDSTPH